MRHTAETLALSALINNPDDPDLFRRHEMVPAYFVGYREEFEWLQSYVNRTDRVPSHEEVQARFPDLKLSQNQIEIGWPVSELVDLYAKRELKQKIESATAALTTNNISDAYEALGLDKPHQHIEPVGLFDAQSIFEHYETPRDAIELPWSNLQGYTDGMGLGELWYMAARPAQGKSYALMAIAANAVMNGQRVIFYSLEMPRIQVQQRIHTILAHRMGYPGITHTALRRKQLDILEYRRMIRTFSEELTGQIHIITPAEARVTPGLLASKADDYDLSVVDYVGLMHTNDGKASIEDWRVAAQISNELRAVTLAKRCRIVAAAQVGRSGAEMRRGFDPPKLSQLAQTDALGQDGDVVVTMNRYARGALGFSLEKNRHGESYVKWYSKFDPEHGDFTEISRDTADMILDREFDEEGITSD